MRSRWFTVGIRAALLGPVLDEDAQSLDARRKRRRIRVLLGVVVNTLLVGACPWAAQAVDAGTGTATECHACGHVGEDDEEKFAHLLSRELDACVRETFGVCALTCTVGNVDPSRCERRLEWCLPRFGPMAHECDTRPLGYVFESIDYMLCRADAHCVDGEIDYGNCWDLLSDDHRANIRTSAERESNWFCE